MIKRLLKILNNEIDSLNSKIGNSQNLLKELKEENDNIKEDVISGLIKDKNQIKEAMDSEKDRYILRQYNVDLEKVNAEIEKWKQKKLNEILGFENEIRILKEEKGKVEKYIEEKPKNTDFNKEIHARKTELENRKKEAEEQLERLTHNGKKSFMGEDPKEIKECQEDIKGIDKELDKLNSEQEKENKKFRDLEDTYNKLCIKYNVKDIIKEEEAKGKEHYENLYKELKKQTESEKEQEENGKKRDEQSEVHFDEVEEENVEDEQVVEVYDEEEHNEEEHNKEEHNEEEYDEDEQVVEVYDEEEHNEEEHNKEEHNEEEYDEDEEEKKPGFFKRLFNKIKEAIKKVVTKVKNGFKKLTSKEVKALDSAKEKIEEQEEQAPVKLNEQARELKGVRAEVDLRDNEEVMKGIRETEEKYQQTSEANPQRMNLEKPDKSDMEGPKQ